MNPILALEGKEMEEYNCRKKGSVGFIGILISASIFIALGRLHWCMFNNIGSHSSTEYSTFSAMFWILSYIKESRWSCILGTNTLLQT